MDFAVHFYIAKDKEGNMGFFKDVRDDIKAVLDRDPAARNGFEVLVCYPGKAAGEDHFAAGTLADRGGDPSGGSHRQEVFHRPRHGDHYRGDHRDRR